MTKPEGFKKFLAHFGIFVSVTERARQGTKITGPLVGSLWMHVNPIYG
jgi:hypothetical protein